MGSGFGLARTKSGATFAAWVNYSSQSTYSLHRAFDGYEMPQVYCARDATSGSGTADLVIARITDAEPTLNHFHFVMGGAFMSLRNDVELVARGDTLLVATHLSGETVPILTYLEIDSTQLQ